MVKMTLGEQLTLFRRRRGLSQDELGAKSGISGNTVGRIESGESSPRVDQLEELAKALGLELSLSLSPSAPSYSFDATPQTGRYESPKGVIHHCIHGVEVSKEEYEQAVAAGEVLGAE